MSKKRHHSLLISYYKSRIFDGKNSILPVGRLNKGTYRDFNRYRKMKDHSNPNFSQDPWPASVAPDEWVKEKAIFFAKQVLSSQYNFTGSVEVDYLSSGWSSQACFVARTNKYSLFIKVVRNFDRESLAALEDEYQAAAWASQAKLGPTPLLFIPHKGVMVYKYLNGGPLTVKSATQRLPEIVALLRRFHDTPLGKWTPQYFHAIPFTRQHYADFLGTATLSSTSKHLINYTIEESSAALDSAPAFIAVASHNDFHIQNIVLDDDKRLFVVDCEDAGLGDPMWDLGSLAANFFTMDSNHELRLSVFSELYGASEEEAYRLSSHFRLALAQYACWTAVHGDGWKRQHQAAIDVLAYFIHS